jgi:hypothetical protein
MYGAMIGWMVGWMDGWASGCLVTYGRTTTGCTRFGLINQHGVAHLDSFQTPNAQTRHRLIPDNQLRRLHRSHLSPPIESEYQAQGGSLSALKHWAISKHPANRTCWRVLSLPTTFSCSNCQCLHPRVSASTGRDDFEKREPGSATTRGIHQISVKFALVFKLGFGSTSSKSIQGLL